MRNKLKEFIVQRDLKISFLHRTTGIHKVTLSKLIRTNAPIKLCVLRKLEAGLSLIGFSMIDLDTLIRLVSHDYYTNCEDGINFSILVRNTESYVRFKLCYIVSIEYHPTESTTLFCEVVFKNGSKLILKDRDMEVFI